MLTSSKYNARISERVAYKDSVPLKMNPYNTITPGKDLIWQLKANRDRTIYIPPENRGLPSITTQDALNVASHVESTMMDDGSSVCGDPVSFPFLKSMESRDHPLQHTQAHFESPAKVFAKLKSKVQRRMVCVKEGHQTEKDMLSRVMENQGAAFNSPRKGKGNIWTIENIKETQRCNVYHDEAEALTLSLTPSPKKSQNYIFSDLSCKPLQEMSPMKDIGHSFKPRNGYTLTKRPVLEPTDVPYPLILVNSDQTLRPPPLFRDLDVFKRPYKTPIKGQPSNLSTEDGTGSHVHKAYVSLDKLPLMSPAKMFAHMKERERKRKWEQQEFYKVSSNTRKLSNGGPTCQPQDRLTSTALGEDNTHNDSSVDVFGSVPGSSFPANQSEMNPCRPDVTDNQSETDPSDDVSPPAVKRRQILVEDPLLHDSLETSTLKKPKMFAHMKERQQQEAYKGSSSTREHRNGGHSCPSRDSPATTTFDRGVLEDDTSLNAGGNPSGRAFPVNRSQLEVADSQSDIDPSDDVLLPPLKSRPALVEDPLVIDSPRIAFPKKREAVFKRNTRPSNATEVYLMKWSMKCNRNGLYVDGIHREDNIPWHSNIIVERVSKSVLKTVSGRTYILVGKMNKDVDSELPKWLLRKFVYGFPPNWKMYYEKFLSESRDNPSMQAERSSKGRGTVAWPASEKPATNIYLKWLGPRPLKTPVSCPPTTSSLPSDTKVSRSGRVIKPPLEYWKGGRVTLDANMNVTIHDGYDTTICKPQVTSPVSRRPSQRPTRVFLPCNEGSSSNNESSVPLRKVKTSHRKRNRAKANLEKKSSNQLELPEEALTSHINSPEEWCGITTRSSQRCRVTQTTSYTDRVPQPQVQPNQSSKLWSKKLNCHHDTGTSPVSVLLRKPNMPAPAEPPTVDDKASTSGDEFSITRKKRGREVHRRWDRKVPKKSQPSHLSPPSQPASSSEDSGRALRKRTAVSRTSDAAQKSKVHKQNKCNKTSPPPKPAPRLIQSSKKSNKGNKSVSSNKVITQEKDEDEWTESELLRLQEAVTSCPKHMGSYWVNVAMMVGTRSAEECQKQHTSQGIFQAPTKRPKKSKKGETIKEPVVEPPTITARVGTLKRKQQVRQFLDAMPKEDLDDVFSSSSMQSKRFQLPSMSPSGKEHGFKFSDHEPLTPVSAGFPTAKTPQCLHITPGMMGSPNRNNGDKYIFQLQKRMKKNQVKHGPFSKSFAPTPSVKRTMRRCVNTENDTFVMWEMFPDSDAAESGEEEDFYFSDKD